MLARSRLQEAALALEQDPDLDLAKLARMRPTPRLQPLTRARVATLGPVGAAWVAALPDILAELESSWSITIGRALPGGSASYVAHATTASGGRAVVKVAVTADGLAEQAATLDRADGRGYARLLDVDADRGALLLESLGRSLQQSARPPADQLRILADTLLLAWQDVAHLGPAPGPDKAASLHQLISDLWPRLARPCSERVFDQALTFAERRQNPAAGDLRIVHGDPHPGNALAVAPPRAGAETGYCFVDPDGFVADRAYDLGVVLRDWSSRLVDNQARARLEGYCQLLADRTGVDATRIWEWGFIERVSTGLYVLSLGAPTVGRPFLDSAERLVA